MFNVGLLVSPIITREILHVDVQKLNPCSVSRGTDQVDREREREGSYKDDSFGRSRHPANYEESSSSSDTANKFNLLISKQHESSIPKRHENRPKLPSLCLL